MKKVSPFSECDSGKRRRACTIFFFLVYLFKINETGFGLI